MADRKTLLSRLVAGDIVLADGPDGARPPCLIYEVTATTIKARAVTTQARYVFDRKPELATGEMGAPSLFVLWRRFRSKFITLYWASIGRTDCCVILKTRH